MRRGCVWRRATESKVSHWLSPLVARTRAKLPHQCVGTRRRHRRQAQTCGNGSALGRFSCMLRLAPSPHFATSTSDKPPSPYTYGRCVSRLSFARAQSTWNMACHPLGLLGRGRLGGRPRNRHRLLESDVTSGCVRDRLVSKQFTMLDPLRPSPP